MRTIIRLSDMSRLEEMGLENLGAGDIQKALEEKLNDDGSRFSVVNVDENIIWGYRNYHQFVETVQEWNASVRNNAKEAVQKWLKDGATLDTMLTFQASVFTGEADNRPHVNGLHCVALKDQYGVMDLHTILTPLEVHDMRQNAEKYIIADVAFEWT